jgi:hypothetical protein
VRNDPEIPFVWSNPYLSSSTQSTQHNDRSSISRGFGRDGLDDFIRNGIWGLAQDIDLNVRLRHEVGVNDALGLGKINSELKFFAVFIVSGCGEVAFRLGQLLEVFRRGPVIDESVGGVGVLKSQERIRQGHFGRVGRRCGATAKQVAVHGLRAGRTRGGGCCPQVIGMESGPEYGKAKSAEGSSGEFVTEPDARSH